MIYYKYLCEMVTELHPSSYEQNAYYQNIELPELHQGNWSLQKQKYKPYEAFVWQDLKQMSDGRLIPQIGFFKEAFYYPAVLENNREWMLITPNEIETMKEPIEKARGKVLTYGLGLGYYTYMVSEKPAVTSVTVVEKDPIVIDIFQKHILPQFPQKNKVHIICEDAFVYAQTYMAREKFDVVFTDIWHDPSDGIALYIKMKTYEKMSPMSLYFYWIEKTMQCYMS